MMIDPVFNWIVALALIQLFASAAWHKARDISGFSQIIASYQILPNTSKPSAALSIIAIEVIAAALIMIPSTRTTGAVLVAALLLGYALVMAINLLRNRRLLDCGCHFGQKKQSISWLLVVRNIAIATLTLLLFLPMQTRAMNIFDLGIVLFGLSLSSMIYVIANELSRNHELLKNG